MKSVVVPTTDVNSETARLIAWHCADGAQVRRNDSIATIETSKAALDLQASEPGFLLQLVPEGGEFVIAHPIGLIFASEAELDQERMRRAKAKKKVGHKKAAFRITRKAAELAEQNGIDLKAVKSSGLITLKDVETAILQQAAKRAPMLAPLKVPAGVERIVLIGGGKAATQIISILRDPQQAGRAVVGILDDTPSKQGSVVDGIPVIGGTTRLGELVQKGLVDSAVVAISTSVAARARFRAACTAAGLPLSDNIIDRSTVIAHDVQMGRGNVICALCHFGNGTKVGDNNFISAYNSFDHHNLIGSDCSTGPGCKASGSVTIGDCVRLGTGIFIEPLVSLGAQVQVSSGAIIINSVADGHIVKTKIFTTVVVPA